jgi:hypothetical protein
LDCAHRDAHIVDSRSPSWVRCARRPDRGAPGR